jgi:hypothetical protein
MGVELALVPHGQRAPRADLNIEMAHITWAGPNIRERFCQELEKSRALLEQLRLDRLQFRVVKSILVDDHRIGEGERLSWFARETKSIDIQEIDYVVFESELKRLLTVFYSKLSPGVNRVIQNEMERYISNKGRTACSHDIALWHCMRLGILGFYGLPVYEVQKTGVASGGGHLVGSFCAGRVASILNISMREHEEDADTELLRHVDFLDPLSVQRYYYF